MSGSGRLGRLHDPAHLDIPPVMYDLWLKCFLDALRKVDPLVDDALVAAWRDALRPGIEAMTRMYGKAGRRPGGR